MQQGAVKSSGILQLHRLTKMALTAKIKLLRILSVVQCCIAVWLVMLGIVERVRVRWQQSGLGMPVWFGIWVRKHEN